MLKTIAMEAGSGHALIALVGLLFALAAVSAWREHRRNRQLEAERDAHLVDFND